MGVTYKHGTLTALSTNWSISFFPTASRGPMTCDPVLISHFMLLLSYVSTMLELLFPQAGAWGWAEHKEKHSFRMFLSWFPPCLSTSLRPLFLSLLTSVGLPHPIFPSVLTSSFITKGLYGYFCALSHSFPRWKWELDHSAVSIFWHSRYKNTCWKRKECLRVCRCRGHQEATCLNIFSAPLWLPLQMGITLSLYIIFSG